MKNLHYIFIMMLCISITATAQNCADIQLKKGQVLTYKREMAPMQKKDITYFKMKKKEQEAADQQYKDDLAGGKLALTTDQMISTLEDVETTPDVVRYSFSSLIKGVAYKTKNICAGPVMIFAPYKDVTEIITPTRNGEMITTQINGYNKIPRVLHVGDTVGSYQNLGVSTPQHFETSGWVSHTEKDAFGDTWKISEWKTQTIDIASSSVTKYVNREVMAEEDLTINGKTYKAYKINTEIWTKISAKADASSVGLALGFAVMNRVINKKTNKAVGANKEGFLVTAINDWFVPALGVMGKTEVFDQGGNRIALITLEDIK
jgi:hypothetical protein